MEDNLNYELIGIRIRDHRKKVNLTQENVAEKIGASTRYISKIETSETKMSLNCLVAIANALGTTTDHLLMDNVVKASTPNLLEELKVIVDDCTPEEIYLISELAKTLKKGVRTKNLKPVE